MEIKINSVADLGRAVRATRKSSKVRLDDLAGIAGVSKQFVSDVERGKQTVQMGLVLRLLAEIGVNLTAAIPPGAQSEWARLQASVAEASSAQAAP